jgi:hypothetical protein
MRNETFSAGPGYYNLSSMVRPWVLIPNAAGEKKSVS